MSEAWVPVLFAAVIVVGAVGGSLAQMVLKELLPLLRTIAEQRSAAPSADLQQVAEGLEKLDQRLAAVEHDQRRLADDASFVRRVLAAPAADETAAQQ